MTNDKTQYELHWTKISRIKLTQMVYDEKKRKRLAMNTELRRWEILAEKVKHVSLSDGTDFGYELSNMCQSMVKRIRKEIQNHE